MSFAVTSLGAPLKAGQRALPGAPGRSGIRRSLATVTATAIRHSCPSMSQFQAPRGTSNCSFHRLATATASPTSSRTFQPSSPLPRTRYKLSNSAALSSFLTAASIPSRRTFATQSSSTSSSDKPLTMATELKVGDSFPEGVSFSYIPYTPESEDINACGIPQKFDASAEFKNKKVVLVSVPGAFTPTCSVSHLPSFINNTDQLKAKGVDQVIVIAYNDAFVMSAWGKAHNLKGDFFVFASDPEVKFSKSLGWIMGERTGRYAIVVDHGKVTYAAKESGPGSIENSGAEAVLPKL